MPPTDQKQYYQDNKDRFKNNCLKLKYGITLEDFKKLVEIQDGCCLICKRKTKLCVDHCHKTGRIRGLLCNSCNGFLGWYEMYDENAKKYLKITEDT